MSPWLPTSHDRSALRRRVRTDCQVVTEEAFKLIAHRTVDLSPNGMLVESDAEVDRGDAVIFSIRLPGGRMWVDGEGVVSRIMRGHRFNDGSRSLGIAFLRMDHLDKALLRAALQGHPPPIPARRVRKDYVSAVRLIELGESWMPPGGETVRLAGSWFSERQAPNVR